MKVGDLVRSFILSHDTKQVGIIRKVDEQRRFDPMGTWGGLPAFETYCRVMWADGQCGWHPTDELEVIDESG